MSSRNGGDLRNCVIRLYQIGIRCLAATYTLAQPFPFELYQIGIRCLAATGLTHILVICLLYQIGIRCLAATTKRQYLSNVDYIKLELDV